MEKRSCLRLFPVLCLCACLLVSFSPAEAKAEEPAAVIRITPAEKAAVPGETFTVEVVAAPNGQALAGLQFNLSYDPAVVRVQSVAEGPLFGQTGADTFFLPGGIDNETGKLANVAGVIMAREGEVSGEAVFAAVTFEAVGEGETGLILGSVVAGDKEAREVPSAAGSASIRVEKGQASIYGDVDGDGEVSAADAVLVLRNVVGLEEFDENQKLRGEVDGNGDITAADAVLILRYAVELIPEFPVEG